MIKMSVLETCMSQFRPVDYPRPCPNNTKERAASVSSNHPCAMSEGQHRAFIYSSNNHYWNTWDFHFQGCLAAQTSLSDMQILFNVWHPMHCRILSDTVGLCPVNSLLSTKVILLVRASEEIMSQINSAQSMV